MFMAVSDYFTSTGFMPHGNCFLWTPPLLWLDVVSDITIAVSYFSIPLAILYFVRKRRDLPFSGIFLMSSAFVLACGSTHLTETWNIWHTDYWADAWIRVVTAIVSAWTAVMLWQLMPRALAIPSREQLESTNRELMKETGLREQAESALRQTNTRLARRVEELTGELAAIVRSSYDAIISEDLNGNIRTWNPAATDLHGYTAAEVIGRPIDILIPHDRIAEVNTLTNRIRLGARIAPFETQRVHRNGIRIDVSVSLSPIKDINGNVTGISTIARDIRERKKSENALLASEERFRSLVEQSIAGIHIVQDGKFVYTNPRGAEIFGVDSADKVIGTEPLHWVIEADRGRIAECMHQLLAGDAKNLSIEFGAVRRDGSEIQIGLSAARATYNGRIALIGLLQDIPEKKRTEEEIRRYDEQIKTAFMSTVKVATTIVEMRDPYTAGHDQRVAEIAVAIATELGFDAHRQEGLRVAGYLHDLGNVTVPFDILVKPAKLSAMEYQLVQSHAQAGCAILENVDFPWPVAQVAHQHHERMDGSGYPQGLKGDAILFEARIVAIADVVEAMCSHRPYRAQMGIEKALAEIEQGRGTLYDVDAVDACLRLFREKAYRIPA